LSDEIMELAAGLSGYMDTGITIEPAGLAVICLTLANFATDADRLQRRADACDVPDDILKMASLLKRRGVFTGEVMAGDPAFGVGEKSHG